MNKIGNIRLNIWEAGGIDTFIYFLPKRYKKQHCLMRKILFKAFEDNYNSIFDYSWHFGKDGIRLEIKYCNW